MLWVQGQPLPLPPITVILGETLYLEGFLWFSYALLSTIHVPRTPVPIHMHHAQTYHGCTSMSKEARLGSQFILLLNAGRMIPPGHHIET